MNQKKRKSRVKDENNNNKKVHCKSVQVADNYRLSLLLNLKLIIACMVYSPKLKSGWFVLHGNFL